MTMKEKELRRPLKEVQSNVKAAIQMMDVDEIYEQEFPQTISGI